MLTFVITCGIVGTIVGGIVALIGNLGDPRSN